MADPAIEERARGAAPRAWRRVVRVLVFAAVVLLIECGYALLAPRYAYPDELSHMQAVGYVQHERGLPDPYDLREKIQQDKHPPYFYVASALALEATRGAFEGAGELRVPGPWARTWELGREQVLSAREPTRTMRDGQLLVLRGISIVHALLAALALLALADLLFPGAPRFAWALALGFATIPQLAWSGASATPDTPLVAFCAWTFYALLRLVGAPRARQGRIALLGGFAFAAALLTKSAAVCLVPVACLAFWMCRRRGELLRSTLTPALLFAAPGLVLAAWWYVYNFAVYGDLFQMHGVVETYTHAVRREPLTWVSFEAMSWDLFRTFFGFDTREQLLPRPLYFVFAALAGVAAAGLALLTRRAVRSEASAEQLRGVALALPAIAVMLALTVVGNMTIPSAQGRYLFPVVPALLVCAGVGFRVALRARGDARLAPPLAVAWGIAGLWLFGECLVARSATRRAHAEQPGVLFYEDCGSPGLHPHQVQGYDAPDRGMLGRVLPERSVSGHPEALVYRFPLAPLRERRDRARSEGVLSAALQLRVRYFNPDSSTPYVAAQVGRFVYATQRLRANGRLVHGAIEISGQSKEFHFPLEDEVLDARVAAKGAENGAAKGDAASEPGDDVLELRFEKVFGAGAVIAELWVEDAFLVLAREAGGGLALRNRGREELRAELRVRDADSEAEPLRASIAAGGSVPVRDALAPAARVQVLALDRSPWMLREAESWQDPENGHWFGQIDASGAYFVSVPSRRPRGPVEHPATIVARMPFEDPPTGATLRVREHRAQMRGAWTWRELALDAQAGFADGVYAYEVAANTPGCVDYVMLIGGWRR